MANAPLKKIITFYCRFTPSYSAIGYYARGLGLLGFHRNFAGQTWLVTGGSEGIGGSAARQAVAGGATVIVVARNLDKLQAFAASVSDPGKIITETADFSLQGDVRALLERLKARGRRIDVLVNNVGIQKHQQVITDEGFETSFVTNILSHYLFTEGLLKSGLLTDSATVIEVSSGGMYNHPLVVKDLNITGEGYLGVRAYGLAKRAQVVLTAWWRKQHAGTSRRFYVMQPGWVDTASVGRSMPRFRAILKSVLRTHAQGADTIVWLAATRPAQRAQEAIWFDRKERTVHIFARTANPKDTAEDLVAGLESAVLPRREDSAARAA